MNHKKISYTTKELESEKWLPIPSYEELYEISNLGRVRTRYGKKSINKKGLERIWRQRILKFKSETNLTYKTGYRVSLWKNGTSKDYLVARLVGSAFLSNELDNKEMTINHINGNRLDNRIENIEWCTLGDNIRKGFETGLFPTKKVILIDKKSNEEIFFPSLIKASAFMEHSKSYLTTCIKNKRFENKQYKWRLV